MSTQQEINTRIPYHFQYMDRIVTLHYTSGAYDDMEDQVIENTFQFFRDNGHDDCDAREFADGIMECVVIDSH